MAAEYNYALLVSVFENVWCWRQGILTIPRQIKLTT